MVSICNISFKIQNIYMLPTQCICSSVTASTDWLCIADGICYCVVATGCVGVTLLRCTINHTLQYRCIFILFSYCFVGQRLSAGISLYSLFFTMIHIYLIPEELYKHTHTHTHTHTHSARTSMFATIQQ